MLDKLKNLRGQPVTTIMGMLAAACGWLSTQPVLDQHPSAKQVFQLLAAGFVALLGGFASEGKPPAP
jgi:hypothetical protein